MTIEAVNSVLSNAPYMKAVAEQQSVATSYAANPDRVQQVSMQAPYLSLYIKVDVNFDRAVLQMRDGDTGDVVRQIPTESQLEAYRRAQASNAVRSPKAEKEIPAPEAPDLYEAAPAPAPTTPDPAPVTSAPAPQASTPAPQSAAPVSVNTEA